MLSLNWWWKANPKGSGSLPAPRSGYVTAIMVFLCSFTHLRIPRSPPKFNQLFTTKDPSIKFHPNPFISFWVMLSTDRQTDKPMLPNTLEALRECRPPWPRQIITPILPTVKILSLAGERLPLPHPHPPPKKKKKKVLDHYLHHDLGMPPLLWCFLLIYSS